MNLPVNYLPLALLSRLGADAGQVVEVGVGVGQARAWAKAVRAGASGTAGTRDASQDTLQHSEHGVPAAGAAALAHQVQPQLGARRVATHLGM